MSPDRYYDVDDLTSFVSDTDLLTAYPDRHVIRVDVLDAGGGTLALVTMGGENRTLTVSDGEQVPVSTRTILAATDTVRLRIFMEKS